MGAYFLKLMALLEFNWLEEGFSIKVKEVTCFLVVYCTKNIDEREAGAGEEKRFLTQKN